MDFLSTLQRIVQNLGFRASVSDLLVVYGLALGRVASALSLTPFFGGQAVEIFRASFFVCLVFGDCAS